MMTQWERAVEAAAKAIHQAKFCNEAPNAIGEVEARWLNKEAAAALRAALPVLFEGRDGRNTFILAEHRRALEAEG